MCCPRTTEAWRHQTQQHLPHTLFKLRSTAVRSVQLIFLMHAGKYDRKWTEKRELKMVQSESRAGPYLSPKCVLCGKMLLFVCCCCVWTFGRYKHAEEPKGKPPEANPEPAAPTAVHLEPKQVCEQRVVTVGHATEYSHSEER